MDKHDDECIGVIMKMFSSTNASFTIQLALLTSVTNFEDLFFFISKDRETQKSNLTCYIQKEKQNTIKSTVHIKKE